MYFTLTVILCEIFHPLFLGHRLLKFELKHDHSSSLSHLVADKLHVKHLAMLKYYWKCNDHFCVGGIL